MYDIGRYPANSDKTAIYMRKDIEMADREGKIHTAEQEVPATIMKKVNCPVILKFENVTYKIESKGRGLTKEKEILKGITGAVVPGEMLAILGPSGSGKTTFLTALGGRLGGQLSGSITYNGKPFSNAMNRNTGFVAQDDKFYAHLTVTETLIFTALLRLPNTLTKKEKIMQAKVVIGKLCLTKCQNNIMGGPFLRGVSGGERKRVSIGQEILINPSLLFLDEPTSGLDSTSAHQVLSMLLELAQDGRTILVSIHQPSSRLFYMFHKVLLLADGNPLYFGKREETMDYFASIGYAPSVPMNPADFLLDLANGVQLDGNQNIVIDYKNKLADRLKEELQSDILIKNQVIDQDGPIKKQFGQWSTTWCQQFMVLLRRELKERKHEYYSRLRISQVLVTSIVCGLLWWQSTTAHLQDQIGLLFFYSMFWSNMPLFTSITTFPQVRMMLTKERSSRMYRLSSYFMAKMTSDLPMELALPTLFVTISYWMGGLKPTARHFLKTLFVLLYSVLVSQGLGLAIGAMIMDLNSAFTLGAILTQMLYLAGGYYVQQVPRFISWFKYISYNYYTYKLLLGSQYKEEDLYSCGPNVMCRVGSYPAIESIGLGNEAISLIALGIMLVGFRVIAYISLMKVGVTR